MSERIPIPQFDKKVTREEWTERRAKEIAAEQGMPIAMWELFLHDATKEWLAALQEDRDE